MDKTAREGTSVADLNTDIRFIKGVGETRARALEKLHIRTLGDLIAYYPRRWEDRTKLFPIRDLPEGEYACCKAMIAQPPTAARIRGGQTLVQVRAVDEGGVLDVSFFHQEYRKNALHPGETYIFYGKVEGGGVRRRMVNPLLETEGKQLLTGRIMPIYPLTAGLTQTMVAKAVRQGLDQCRDLPEDVLPDGIRQAHHLCYAGFAYENIHFPASEEALNTARRRLVFEELFLLSCGLSLLRQRRETVAGLPCQAADMAPFYAALPFALTAAQRRAIADAVGDMTSGRPMNRLCQGDVGSGKTIVAFMTMLIALDNGFQACIMAPTEILATQHYESISEMASVIGVHVGLLTGSTGKKERDRLHAALLDGSLQILIGTHALIEDTVQFRNLGLAVIDEQHRFGVVQRSRLWKKNSTPPHVLVMTATPIPRTLSMTVYGDLDVSVIDELPPGRKPVTTRMRYESDRQQVYHFLGTELRQGRQAYIVYPLIESTEKTDLHDLINGYEAVSQEFPHYRVVYVHGKMKPKEKQHQMELFVSGQAQILVATTVIEVGVNVPNASVMIIENAERFGLSQLHQLRGRVGRGADQSYCILMTKHQIAGDTRKRLEVMVQSNDGFKIAEEDMKLRGPGDMEGTQQSGVAFNLKLTNLATDGPIVEMARNDAMAVLDADPALQGQEGRRLDEHMHFLRGQQADWSLIS